MAPPSFLFLHQNGFGGLADRRLSVVFDPSAPYQASALRRASNRAQAARSAIAQKKSSFTRQTNPCFAGLVAFARGPHPIPFRTRPLNPSAPMVLWLKPRESRSLPGLQSTFQIFSPQPPPPNILREYRAASSRLTRAGRCSLSRRNQRRTRPCSLLPNRLGWRWRGGQRVWDQN